MLDKATPDLSLPDLDDSGNPLMRRLVNFKGPYCLKFSHPPHVTTDKELLNALAMVPRSFEKHRHPERLELARRTGGNAGLEGSGGRRGFEGPAPVMRLSKRVKARLEACSKQRVVPAPDVAQDRGLKFRHDVQGDDLPPNRLEGSVEQLAAASERVVEPRGHRSACGATFSRVCAVVSSDATAFFCSVKKKIRMATHVLERCEQLRPVLKAAVDAEALKRGASLEEVSRLHDELARGAPVLERLIADGLAGRFPAEEVDIRDWKECGCALFLGSRSSPSTPCGCWWTAPRPAGNSAALPRQGQLPDPADAPGCER